MSSNRSVLVTGAGSGIGLASALVLAECGYRVYAAVFDTGQGEEVRRAAASRGVSLIPVQLDITDQASVTEAVNGIISESGPLFGLVNSAGVSCRGFFEDTSAKEVHRVYEVNVFGAMNVARAVLPCMREAQRGRIVLIGSMAGRVTTMTLSAYGSGKAALEGFGEALNLEVAPFGLHVSIVEPGLVLTPRFTHERTSTQAATQPHSPYYSWFLQHEYMVSEILLKQRTTPAHVAYAVRHAVRTRRPRLRYVVGRGAKIVIALRRLLPERAFERIYFRSLIRRVTLPDRRPPEISKLTLPGSNPWDYLGLPPPKSGVAGGGRDITG